MDGIGEGQGRNDSSRRQEEISAGRRDPRPMWTQRNNGGNVRVFLFPPLGVVTVPWQSSSVQVGALSPSPVVGGYGYSDGVRLQLSGEPQVSEQQRGSRGSWAQTLALPLISCVTLGDACSTGQSQYVT